MYTILCLAKVPDVYCYTFPVLVRTATYRYVLVRTKYPVPVQQFMIPDEHKNFKSTVMARKHSMAFRTTSRVSLFAMRTHMSQMPLME